MARLHRVTVQLVYRLVADAKKRPEKLREAKEKVELAKMKDDAVLAEAKAWQKSARPLSNAM